MREHLEDLRDTVRAVASGHRAEDSVPDTELDHALWKELESLGLIAVAADESVGGAGGDLVDAATVLAEVAATRIPYAEAAFVAAPALSAAGLQLPDGVFTAARADPERLTFAGGVLKGSADRVPWARHGDHLVLLHGPADSAALSVVPLAADGVEIAAGANLAGEPRDLVELAGVRPTRSVEVGEADVLDWELRAALSRAVAAGGVAGAVVDVTLAHVSQRTQFGRPLAAFQAIQQSVAGMATQATAIQVGAGAAVAAMVDDPDIAEVLVAAAVCDAATLTRPLSAAAHQAHGAIGFTREYLLGSLTTRLWSWRDEHGNERLWAARLGAMVGAAPLWTTFGS